MDVILKNLLMNSIKAVRQRWGEDRGRIVIKIQEFSDRLDMIAIAVEDNGIGILAEDRRKIFQWFWGRSKGWGVGLAFCQILAERNGGELVFDDQFNEGARFILALPRRSD